MTCHQLLSTIFYGWASTQATAKKTVAAQSNSEPATSRSTTPTILSYPTQHLWTRYTPPKKPSCESPIRKTEREVVALAMTPPAPRPAQSGPSPAEFTTSCITPSAPKQTFSAHTLQPLPTNHAPYRPPTSTKSSNQQFAPSTSIRKASLLSQSVAILFVPVAQWPCTSITSTVTKSANKAVGLPTLS